MSWAKTLGFALAAFAIVTALLILTSRAAIEKLVGVGLLPRVFVSMVPVLTVIARSLAVLLILAGAVQFGIEARLISLNWMERYGFSLALVALGGVLLVLVGRRQRG